MHARLVLGAAVVAVVACQGTGYFVCSEDAECAAAAGAGVCQPTGACSFPDDGCTSGQRYGSESPPELAGECVALDEGSTSMSGGSGSEEEATGSTTTAVDSTGPIDPSGDDCPPDWWDCAWAHRQPLTLTRPIAAPLDDVPVLILITEGRVAHELMQADGEDVRFVSAQGTNLPHEVERWEPQGISTIWVRVDELGGASDHLWIYYGNPSAEGADVPQGAWSDPFVGVWHLEEDPTDSTPNANDASTSGTVGVTHGQIANGMNFGSSTARLDVGATPSVADVFATGGTITAWIRPRGWGGGNFGRIANKDAAGSGWSFNVGGGGQLRFGFVPNAATGAVIWGTPNGALETHRWAHVAVTYAPLNVEAPLLYVNGVLQELGMAPEPPMVAEPSSDAEIPLALGNRANNDRRFDGILDEIRIQTVVRDPEWIEVQAESERDELLIYGAIESWEVGG
ncbi:DUF2341 domain-containing protein [Paraliomyxa miuraensis]|uniref:DUF2341 domain-containing protein n=1 Tax=Paraliomyxa miuraensis TaxID=376150 RepID=UPI0022557EF0|nr:DUF2341 domain-containing protein [Paraliomyxa miuraensis]MCX4243508.1 DUF2341 domain-containing protein [Paraliomyxa miuraensis]